MKLRADSNKNSLESGDVSDIFAHDGGFQAFFQEQPRLDILKSLRQLVLSEDEPLIEDDAQNYQGVLLLGNKGIGKTSLIREFVDHLDEDLDVNIAFINAEHIADPNFTPGSDPSVSVSVSHPAPALDQTDDNNALFSALLKSFGVTEYQCDSFEMFQKSFMDIARFSRECERRVVVIIDNAHRLSSDTISELLLLNNACNEKQTPVSWVFSAEPGLDRVFETLSQKHKELRIEQSFQTLRLHAFNLEDTERFISFCCEHAGIRGGLNLKASDIQSIYDASQGSPGLIPNVIRRVLQNSNNPKNIIERIPRMHRLVSAVLATVVGFLIVISVIFEDGVGELSLPRGEKNHQTLGEGAVSTEPQWFLEQNPQEYTIQLISSENGLNIDKYMRDYSGEVGNSKLYKLKSTRGDKDWYLVFCGLFEDKASALAFSQKLPEKMQITEPWVRSFQHVQQEIQNKTSVSLINQ